MNRPYIMYEKVCTYVVLRSSFVYILNLVRCISRAFSLYITSYVCVYVVVLRDVFGHDQLLQILQKCF